MLDNPIMLMLVFLLALGEGDLVAGICSLMWLFVPIQGRHTPFNSTRTLAYKSGDDETIKKSYLHTPDSSEDEDEDTDTDVCGCCYKEDGKSGEEEKTEEAYNNNTTEKPENLDDSKTEVVPPTSTAWKTYWNSS